MKFHGYIEKGKLSFNSTHIAHFVKILFPEASINCPNLNACASLIRIQS